MLFTRSRTLGGKHAALQLASFLNQELDTRNNGQIDITCEFITQGQVEAPFKTSSSPPLLFTFGLFRFQTIEVRITFLKI